MNQYYKISNGGEINKINYLSDWKTFQHHVANVLRKTYGGVKEEMYIDASGLNLVL